MNPKQTIPFLLKIAPPLALGAVIFCAVKSLLSDDERKNQPEIKPDDIPPENRKNSPQSSVTKNRKYGQNTGIPANSAGKTDAVPLVFQAISALNSINAAIPLVSGNFPPEKAELQSLQPQFRRKIITRENMEAIFQRGVKSLRRPEIVAALKTLGFGKSAAYEALEQGGRFASWLQFAPDGMISWQG